MEFKACLHLHINEDPIENIGYSAYQAIDKAFEHGFLVIAFTCHNKFIDNKKYQQYANQKGILLLSGIEATIEGKHVLIYNCTQEVESISTFNQLRQYKKKYPEILIIAAHPYHLTKECLSLKLIEHIDLFDAIEFSFFYHKLFNPNKKAIKTGKTYKKPIIATADIHFLEFFNVCYTTVEATKLEAKNIIEAIKKNRVDITSKSFSILELIRISYKMITISKKNNVQQTD